MTIQSTKTAPPETGQHPTLMHILVLGLPSTSGCADVAVVAGTATSTGKAISGSSLVFMLPMVLEWIADW